LQFPVRDDERLRPVVAVRHDRPAGRAPIQRVPRTDPIRDVIIRPRRLDHRDRQCLGAVDDRQVRGRADLLRQSAQRNRGRVAQQRLYSARQRQDADAEPGPPGRVPAGQAVQLQGGQQPVDDGAIHPEMIGQFRDGEPRGCVGQLFERAQAPVEGLRGLWVVCGRRHSESLGREVGNLVKPGSPDLGPRVRPHPS